MSMSIKERVAENRRARWALEDQKMEAFLDELKRLLNGDAYDRKEARTLLKAFQRKGRP
jgi:DNA-binding SARP family transcriptional activator